MKEYICFLVQQKETAYFIRRDKDFPAPDIIHNMGLCKKDTEKKQGQDL